MYIPSGIRRSHRLSAMCIHEHHYSVVPLDYLALLFHNLSMFVISSNRGVCLLFNLHLKKKKNLKQGKFTSIIIFFPSEKDWF